MPRELTMIIAFVSAIVARLRRTTLLLVLLLILVIGEGIVATARGQPCDGTGSLPGGDFAVQSADPFVCVPTTTTYGGFLEVATPRQDPPWMTLAFVNSSDSCTTLSTRDLVYWACSGSARVRLWFLDGCQYRFGGEITIAVVHQPSQFHWSSPQYSDWFAGENWSLGYAPTDPGDRVFFDRPVERIGAYLPVSTRIDSLHFANGGGGLFLDGNTLHVSRVMTVNGNCSIACGSVDAGGDLNIESHGVVFLFPLSCSGTSAIPPSLRVEGTLTVQQGGTLRGGGGAEVIANVLNQGDIYCYARLHSPLPDNQLPPGPLFILGSLTCDPGFPDSSITIDIESAGDNMHGQLVVRDTLSLQNWIKTSVDDDVPPFQWDPGDRFRVITAMDGPGGVDSTWSGRFSRYGVDARNSAFLAVNHDYSNARHEPRKSIELLCVANPFRWSLGAPGTQSKMVFVTHGTASGIGPANDGAFGQMAHSMARFARSSHLEDVWDIYTLNWYPFSTPGLEFNPWESARIGAEIGESLVQLLVANSPGGVPRYREFHLLSHSSGSWFVDRMADRLADLQRPRPLVHLTVFDTFEPPSRTLGEIGETTTRRAEQYLDSSNPLGLLYGTNATLLRTVNLDVTNMPGHPIIPIPAERHAWPYRWYLSTIQAASADDAGILPPPTCVCSPVSTAWGFEQSPMYRQYVQGLPGGGSSCPALTAPAAVRIRLPDCGIVNPANRWRLIRFSPTNTYFGPTGTGWFAGLGNVGARTGSPISVITSIDSAMPFREIRFNYEYRLAARGVLTLTLDGNEIFRSEQNFEGGGVLSSSELWFDADAPAGNHVLVFTLDPQDGPQSEVLISNLELGDYVVPCPADLDDGTNTGTPDGGVTIEDLLYYLDQYAQGTTRADLDDGSGTGMPDGGVTIDDLLYFLVRYEAGC